VTPHFTPHKKTDKIIILFQSLHFLMADEKQKVYEPHGIKQSPDLICS
jgi:hypothetical protein